MRDFVDAVWPALSAPALLSRLYADSDFLLSCSTGVLDDAERAALARPAGTSLRATRWSAADAVLVDELSALLDSTQSFVHVVVDEAQDLSPMQCRAVARRVPLGSVTVLGDLAQATAPWAPGDWAVTLTHLGHPGAEVRPLTAGYRVPGDVLVVANRLLPHIAPQLPPATSIRAGGDALTYTDDLLAAVRGCLAAEGSVGVIVPDRRAAAVLDQLAPLGAGQLEAGDEGSDPRLAVVAASAAKGLEFDSVVLFEPAEIVAGEATRLAGLRRLYVVLTRAVSRLAIVHTAALPAEMTAADQRV